MNLDAIQGASSVPKPPTSGAPSATSAGDPRETMLRSLEEGGTPTSKQDALTRLNALIKATWSKHAWTTSTIALLGRLRLIARAIEENVVIYEQGWMMAFATLGNQPNAIDRLEPAQAVFAQAVFQHQSFNTIEGLKELAKDLAERYAAIGDKVRERMARMVLVALNIKLTDDNPTYINLMTRRILTVLSGEPSRLADTFFEHGRNPWILQMSDALREFCECHRSNQAKHPDRPAHTPPFPMVAAPSGAHKAVGNRR